VQDAAGNEAGFFQDELSSRLFPVAIEVVNLGSASDFNPPRLISMTALTPTRVDSSRPLQSIGTTVSFRVVAQDDLSGVQLGIIDLDGADIDPATVTLPKPLLPGAPVTFDINVTISPFMAPSTYAVGLILADTSGYSAFYTSSDLANRSFPFQIEVVNARPDTTPPELLSMTALTPITVDLSQGNGAVVEMELVALDSQSGFHRAELFTTFSRSSSTTPYTPPRANVYAEFRLGKPAGSGVAVSFPMRLSFPRYIDPGDYPLTVVLYDAQQNTKVMNTSALATMSLPSSIKVINSDRDTTAPTLINFTANNAVNVTYSAEEVIFEIMVQDSQTGFDRGKLVVWEHAPVPAPIYAANTPPARSALRAPDVNVSAPVVSKEAFVAREFFLESAEATNSTDMLIFNVSFVVPLFTPPGAYPLQLSLYDVAQNVAVFSTTYLSKQRFANVVQVNNLATNVDTTPPTISALYAYYPKRRLAWLSDLIMPQRRQQDLPFQPEVNVSWANASVTLRMRAQDTETGVIGGLVTLRHRETNQLYTKAIKEFATPIDSVRNGSVEFNITIPFERFIRSGIYELDVLLRDGASNTANITSHILATQDLVSHVVVHNNRVDTVSPTLLNMTAVTPTTVQVSESGPPQTVSFTFTVDDDVSGLATALLEIDNWFTFPTVVDLTRRGALIGNGVLRPYTFRINVTVPSFVATGNYSLSMDIYDEANNVAVFDTASLLARGFPAIISVRT
jgi:hypothetical protein